MIMRSLGTDGPRVSLLGLGTVKLGRDRAVKYPTRVVIPDDEQALALLECAHECGINLLDTAPAYGTSERRLGELLGRTSAGRDAWVIATKAGEEFSLDDAGRGGSAFDFSPEAIRSSVERSLQRLKVEALGCVLLHSDGSDLQIIESSGAIEALEALRDEGKIRAMGISTKTPEGGLAAVERCDVVMLTANPSYSGDEPAIRRAGERGVGVLIKKALQSGHAPDVERAIGHVLRPEIGACVSSVIVGTTSPAHLRRNAELVAQGVA